MYCAVYFNDTENTSRTVVVYPNILEATLSHCFLKEFVSFPITMSSFAVWFIMVNLATKVKTGKGNGEKTVREYVQVKTVHFNLAGKSCNKQSQTNLNH